MAGRRPTTQTVKTSEARQQWSQLVNQVGRGEIRVLVEKGGLPVAAIVSAEDLERLNRLDAQRSERFKALEESWVAFQDVPPGEVEREVAKAVAAARRKHRAERQQATATS